MEHAAPTENRAVRVSTLELFFDLVFVFTLTQLTGLLAAEPDWRGLLKVVLLFSVIWWIYDGYVWLTNALTLDVLGDRLLLIGGMAGFLILALAVPTTFEDGGVAAGLKKAIPDPLDSLDELTAVALAAGTAMFVAADAALLRVLGIEQSASRAVATVAILATIPLGAAVSAAVQVAAVAAIVAAALAADAGQRVTTRR